MICVEESRIKLMELLYKTYDAMVAERAASFDDEPETEETRRMQSDVLLKRLFRRLKDFYRHRPGG